MKTCSRCKQIKGKEEFAKRRSARDGLYHWCRQCCAAYKLLIKDRVAASKKRWAAAHRDALHRACSRWYAKNKTDKMAKAKQRYKQDLRYRLASTLRSRLSHAVRAGRAGSALKELGCSIEQLRVYLESKFLPGMSWDNYGRRGWHIDHIIPLSKFDLSDPEQLKKACHYTNLQPLWWDDNLSKGNN